jgi:aspartyl aminopeptidase
MNTAIETTKDLIRFIDKSPTAFQCVDTVAAMLDSAGFSMLSAGNPWTPEPGKGYYTTVNRTTLIAFRMPLSAPTAFRITASHSDSPTFALKYEYESESCGRYLRLNTERYGGMIQSSWLDRPLSLAGRIIVKDGDGFASHSVKIDRDLLMIPNVAIHLNRTINEGYKYNPAVDLMPLFGGKDAKGKLKAIIAETAGVDPDSILSMDLYLYCRTPGTVWGAEDAFFSAPRIDNLMCAYGTLRGFLDATPAKDDSMVSVYAVFDNEETGSSTKQGAGALIFRDVLERIAEASGTDVRRMLASSFMVSADNAHARHPNHPELSDAQNAPYMNEGIVIKLNASQKYATEALSSALFSEICRRADVPVQRFSNRSDMLGGSTLGSICDTFVPLLTVDIGMAQLAMHSCYETAGTLDTEYLVRAMKEFYETEICSDRDGMFTVASKKSEG